MSTIRRITIAVIASLVLLAAAPVAAGASTQGDTTAVAINTRDGGSVFRLAFSVRRVMDGTVDQSNVAAAVASCTDCETVALAFQVVLVMSDPDVVTPENLALSINTECTFCTTYAAATQIVLGTDGVVRLTDEGQRRLAALRTRLLGLRHEELTVSELEAAVDEARTELADILKTELVAVGPAQEEPATSSSTSSSTTSTTSTTTSSSSTTTTSPTASTSTSSSSTSTTTTTAG